MPVTKQCEHCRRDYLLKSSWKAARSRFCSRQCKWDSERTTVKRCCGFCGKQFTAWPSTKTRFCSRKCAGTANPNRSPGKPRKYPDDITSETKTCLRCCKVKIRRQFHKDSGRYDGLAAYCKQCIKQYQNGFYNSIDKRLVRRLHCSLYRARRKNAAGSYNKKQLIEKFTFWGWRCYLCLTQLDAKTCTIEHRKPLSRGGTNWLANIAPACLPCNSSKQNKTQQEYITFFKQKIIKGQSF